MLDENIPFHQTCKKTCIQELRFYKISNLIALILSMTFLSKTFFFNYRHSTSQMPAVLVIAFAHTEKHNILVLESSFDYKDPLKGPQESPRGPFTTL